MAASSERTPTTTVPWGIYGNNDATNGILGIVIEDGTYSAYDTPQPNITSSGVVATSAGGSANYISDATYRDESETGDADGFRKFTGDTAINTLGLMTLVNDFHGKHAGDKVPYGWYFTWQILDHRDRILSDLGYDSPSASQNETEYQSLVRLIAAIQSEMGATKYQQFYFPAVSYCHAYEPTILRNGEELADKFKAGNWWLPSPGEEGRIYWYYSKGYNYAEHAIFSDARTKGVLTAFYTSGHWTSVEYTAAVAWYVNFGSGVVSNNVKYNGYAARAVVAF